MPSLQIQNKPKGLLHNILKGNESFVILHVDHLALISKLHSLESRYIFVVVDAFIKYLKLYATESTAKVIKCLKVYFEHYNRALCIASDRGNCFTSCKFEEFLKDRYITYIQHIEIFIIHLKRIASPKKLASFTNDRQI